MGTRADFYSSTTRLQWLGSIGWDGYPEGMPADLLGAKSQKEFQDQVVKLVSERDDGTKPEDGWPWPWKDSCTTDYAYAWCEEHNRVVTCPFGDLYWSTEGKEIMEKRTPFPDMSEGASVTLGKRSGVLLLG